MTLLGAPLSCWPQMDHRDCKEMRGYLCRRLAKVRSALGAEASRRESSHDTPSSDAQPKRTAGVLEIATARHETASASQGREH